MAGSRVVAWARLEKIQKVREGPEIYCVVIDSSARVSK